MAKAAYNMGPGNLKKVGPRGFEETANYIDRINEAKVKVTKPEPEPEPEPEVDDYPSNIEPALELTITDDDLLIIENRLTKGNDDYDHIKIKIPPGSEISELIVSVFDKVVNVNEGTISYENLKNY
jgi:hypothetical protein